MREDRHKEVMNVFIEATKARRKAEKDMAREAKKRERESKKAEKETSKDTGKKGVDDTADAAKKAKDAADAAKKAKDTKDAADAAKKAKDATDATKKAKDAADAADAAKKAKDAADAADAAKKAKDAADAAKKAKDAKDAADAAKKAKEAKDAAEAKRIKDAAEAKQRAADTAKKQETAPATSPTATPAPPVTTPKPGIVKPAITEATKTAVKISMSGRAAQVAAGLSAMGITSAAAMAGIIATSAKESGLDPNSKEDGVERWKNTLDKRGLEYLYLKFPQLKAGGRVAKQLNFPKGVPEDYIRNVMGQGDEAWFSLVYPGGAEAYKYRGRGLIQITGKNVYKKVGDIIGVDLEKNPDLITQDFGIAIKATAAYLMNSIGSGDPKKGLAILNSFTDENEARKWIIANVASGSVGYNKQRLDKLFDSNTNIGKTTISQFEASNKFSSLGSTAASEALNNKSVENADMRKDMSQGSAGGSPVIIQNNNTTQAKTNIHRVAPKEELNPTMR
jgi:predicted chitinase